MPSSKKKLKLKAKKDKKSRRLSTEEILQLIKKMRPKTQQIVKVNVGDKSGKDSSKKQSGQVQTSYNPPFIIPTQGQAFTTLGQPPYQPPLMEAPKQAATWTTQPVVAPVKLLVDPEPEQQKIDKKGKTPRATRKKKNIIFVDEYGDPIRFSGDSESESSVMPLKSSVREREFMFGEAKEPGLSFSQPKGWSSSSLSASAAAPTFFNLGVQNDKYQADIIHTESSGDQIGTIANSLSSSEWTGSPAGDAAPIADIPITDVPVEQPELVQPVLELPELEDVYIAPELKPPKVLKTIPPIPEDIITEMRAPKTLPPVEKIKKISDKVIEINTAFEQGYFENMDWIPSKFIIKRGVDKGKMSPNIKKEELIPIYSAFKNIMVEK